MAKMIRCRSGHVYDSQAHDSCPECARTGVAVGAAQRGQEDGGGGGGGKRSTPMPWLAIGGAAVVLLGVVGFFLFKPSSEEKGETSGGIAVITEAMSDADFQACRKTVGDDMQACERAIAAKKFNGPALAALYSSRGAGHAKKNELDAGIADVTEAIKLDPNFAPAFSNRGAMYRSQGKLDSAIQDFERAIKADPKFPNTYLNRGGLYFDKGEYDRAIADYDQVIQLDPKTFKGYWARGDAYLKKGDRDRAAEDYRKALSLNPGEADKKKLEAALNLAKSGAPSPAPTPRPAPQAAATPSPSTADPKSDPDYQTCAKVSGDGVIPACDRAIQSGKFSGDALAVLYFARGTSQLMKRNLDAAISDLSEAIKLDPYRAVALGNRGVAFHRKGERDKALEDLDRSIKLNPSNALDYNSRGLVHADMRDYDRAVQDYTEALTLDPNYLKAYRNRGDAYRRKGEKELAAADYQKALSLNPDDAVKKQINAALYALGSAPLAAPSPPPTAQQTIRKVEAEVKASPKAEPAASTPDPRTDPDYQACQKSSAAACGRAIASGKFGGSDLAQLYAHRAGEALFRGDPGAAVADFSEAARIHPDYDNLINLGIAYNEKGDHDGAIQTLDKAIALDPKREPAFRSRGIAYAGKGAYDRAIQDFGQAIMFKPGDPILYRLRADAYAKKGDRKHAAEDYNKGLSLKPDKDTKNRIEASLKALDSGPTSPASSVAPSAQSADANKGQVAYATTGLTAKDRAAAAQDPDFKSCYDLKGKKAELLESCDRAIHSGKFSGPALSELYANKGLLTSDRDIALSAYDQATKLDPKNVWAFTGRADIYLSRGKNDLAIEDYNTAVGLNPKFPVTYVMRAAAFGRAGDNARAMEDFKKAIELDPKRAKTYESRGAFLMRKKDLDGAKKDYDQAISLDPKSTSALSLRAAYYSVKKQYDLALKDLDEIIRLAPDSKSYFNRGKFHMGRKDKDHAIADLNKASTLDVEGEYKVPIQGMLRRLEMLN